MYFQPYKPKFLLIDILTYKFVPNATHLIIVQRTVA